MGPWRQLLLRILPLLPWPIPWEVGHGLPRFWRITVSLGVVAVTYFTLFAFLARYKPKPEALIDDKPRCLHCNTEISPALDACPACGWSYKR